MTEAQIDLLIKLYSNWNEHGYPTSDIDFIKSLILDGYEYSYITEKYSDFIRERKEKLEQLQKKITALESELEEERDTISNLESELDELKGN